MSDLVIPEKKCQKLMTVCARLDTEMKDLITTMASELAELTHRQETGFDGIVSDTDAALNAGSLRMDETGMSIAIDGCVRRTYALEMEFQKGMDASRRTVTDVLSALDKLTDQFMVASTTPQSHKKPLVRRRVPTQSNASTIEFIANEPESAVVMESSFCPNVTLLSMPPLQFAAVACQQTICTIHEPAYTRRNSTIIHQRKECISNHGGTSFGVVLPCHCFYASTILMEFCIHRERMRRFSVVHLLHRMGHTVDAVNKAMTRVDDTLYRRIITDHRLCFLAEGYSPKIRVYRGRGWWGLWTAFLQGKLDESFSALAGELLEEVRSTDPSQLVACTVLAAIEWCNGSTMDPQSYEASEDMAYLAELDTRFMDAICKQGIIGGHLLDFQNCTGALVRAWPVCLRIIAVEHIQLCFSANKKKQLSPSTVSSVLERSPPFQRCLRWN